MRGPLIALCFVALSLAWLVFFGAGVRQADWDAALLFLGATALFYWMFRSGQTPPRMPLWHVAVLWSLPAYAAIQLIPLPPSILGLLSPARSSLTAGLAGVIPNLSLAPIAVAPAGAVYGLFSLLAYLTVFSLMRDLEWRLAVIRPWLASLPLILVAAMEACIAVGQWIGGGVVVRGTLSNIENFACLLEVALPFSLMFGFISFRRHQTQGSGSLLPAVRAAASWLASLMILLALVHTTSQTSHAVVIVSLFLMLAFALIPRLRTRKLRLIGAGAASLVALVTLLIAVSPVDIPQSLAQLGTSDQETADARLSLWNSSASLLGEYHWLGTGMGGFETTFLTYQGSTDLNRIQQPNNDVLAMLITFGIVGSLVVLASLVGVLRPAILGAIYLPDESRRLLAAAITAALCGLLIRSSLESAVSIPVIAMVLAWVAGMSLSSGVD